MSNNSKKQTPANSGVKAEPEEHVHVHEHSDDNTHVHSHTHSPEEYKKLIHRTSIIIGHVTSIKKMLEEERDCSEVLIQISAVQSSLNSLGKLILKSHINECLIHANSLEDPTDQHKVMSSLNDAIDKFVR